MILLSDIVITITDTACGRRYPVGDAKLLFFSYLGKLIDCQMGLKGVGPNHVLLWKLMESRGNIVMAGVEAYIFMVHISGSADVD